MRCPKCHYLSFDPEPRCKNCGYDLEVADTDLALRTAEDAESAADNDRRFSDLTLRERPQAVAPITLELGEPALPPVPRSEARLTLVEDRSPRPDSRADRASAQGAPSATPEARTPFRAPHTTTDLPLFMKALPDLDELSAESNPGRQRPPVASRPPLGVRRTAAEPARARQDPPQRRPGPLDYDLLEDLKRVEREEAEALGPHGTPGITADNEPVAAGDRAAAAAVDIGVLAAIAGFVLWATLRLCNVGLDGLGVEALVPLVAFLVIIAIGYLLMFTAAGGQTVGKMLLHIRVVGDSAAEGAHLSVRRSAVRASLTFLSVIGLGLGWLPALLGRGLALNDRFAHTRVVRA